YASLTFLHEAAKVIDRKSCPVYIYHFGDLDPSGLNAAEETEEALRAFAPTADITFKRLAVLVEQVEQWDLFKRGVKKTDPRAKNYPYDFSCELDAIEPRRLRSLVEKAIQRHMSKKKYEELMEQEKREQKLISKLVEKIDIDEELDNMDGDDDG